MSFKKPVLPVLEPKEGYNRLNRDYAKHHTHLNSFDKGTFMRMLPRTLKGASILDLGAGDGRLFPFLRESGYERYVAADISEALLARHPGVKGVEKVVCDIEGTLPFEDNSFDLVLAFFVFEHIDELRHLFEEVFRILKPGASRVVGHFLHRREFVFKDKQGDFKIRQNKRKYEDLDEYAAWAFFESSYIEVIERGNELGRIYKFTKGE